MDIAFEFEPRLYLSRQMLSPKERYDLALCELQSELLVSLFITPITFPIYSPKKEFRP